MKHQITFLGGQLLPIYIGIREFAPDKIHFLASEESKEGVKILKGVFPQVKSSEFVCDPFDFLAIKKRIETIFDKLEQEDELLINLTGGTKIMLLAAQSIIFEKMVKGFYVNQDNSYIEIPSYVKSNISSELLIKEFLCLSGHNIYTAKKFKDFNEKDVKLSFQIETFATTNKIYSKVTDLIRKKYKDLPESGIDQTAGNVEVKWNSSLVEINNNQRTIASFKGQNVHSLFFNATWWELIVASELNKWVKAKELLIHCELPFRSDNKSLKNEIDILINTGSRLIFVECKSGNIKQEDINKMKIIKQTYGGVISKALLVSLYMPSQNIIEKCKELDIELFYVYAFNRVINPLSGINKILDKLSQRASL